MKVLNFSGQAGFAKRKGRKATQRTQWLNPTPEMQVVLFGGGGENQANMETGCHVISMPGLCRALGWILIQRMQDVDSPSRSRLAKLQTGSRCTRAQLECIVNTSNHSSQSSNTSELAGAQLEELERSPPGTTMTHIRTTQEGVLQDIS